MSSDPRIRKELAECAANANCGVTAIAINNNIHKLDGQILGSQGKSLILLFYKVLKYKQLYSLSFVSSFSLSFKNPCHYQ